MNFSRTLLSVFALSLVVRPVMAAEPSDKRAVNSSQPPVIPIGEDAYRMWDRWAYLRIGMRAYMTSTYDRRGGNEAADASHFLYQLADDYNVSLDVTGPGVLVFARYNHWHGSPWHYLVDGRETMVRETSTADPNRPDPNSVFLPEELFPNPLTWTWSITKGADLMWVPIPFEKSFRMGYSRTHYGTGYYICQKVMPGATNLSRPIKSWDAKTPPSEEVLGLIRRAGEDIAPTGGEVKKLSGTVALAPRKSHLVAEIEDAPSTVRALKFSVPRDQAMGFSRARIRIWWDGREHASVDSPVNLFFGAGSVYNRTEREFLVKGFPVNIRFDKQDVHFAVYFPMPFLKNARIELTETQGKEVKNIRWSLRYLPYRDPANWVGHFHATYKDHPNPVPGEDNVLLDTRETEGGGDWCGHFVGTSFVFSDRAVLNTLEGDPRFFFDDSQTPQAQGTGTEEWGGGGDYWGGRNMTLPFAGHPVGARNSNEAKDSEDLIQSAYRFLLADLMPFGKNARIQLEHGGLNDSKEHYQTVTYWYGINQPCLVLTDFLRVGDEADEKCHDYASPEASAVQTLTSRYEWGVDTLQGKEIYAATTDVGRYTEGTSIFSLRLDPQNIGVLLRRKFDYAFPNQQADISVADENADSPWHAVGVWYTAGSNTVVYSNPREELGETQHVKQTSNRRWREDEFLLPRELTEGKSSIRVKVEFVPKNVPLFPGEPLAKQAWSEYAYSAYCYIMPTVE
jgi:hypothetical protein